ncbi:M48 family metallopeptidase [Methylopila turkensis]|nr:M48 family metallopeptidase [Methylopila turkensis]
MEARGVYFDGLTSRRHEVDLVLGDMLALVGPDGRRLAIWPYADIRALASPPDLLRLTREGGPPLARLELRDAGLIDAVRRRSVRIAETQAEERGGARRVVLWSFAAVLSLALFAVFGVPALAERVTPLLPWSVDQRMGAAADAQIRLILPTRGGSFGCGEGAEEAPGRAALDTLVRRLSDAAALPVPIEVTAVRSGIPNAIALPGGRIYLFDGLIREAENADEIAGVLAHEIAHVAHRDGARRTLQAGGTSFLLGFVLGDVTGGGAAVFVARTLIDASYSRDAETAADAYAVDLMRRIGGDPRGLGTLLTRLTEEETEEDAKDETKGEPDARGRRSALDYLASHPATAERRAAIDAAAGRKPATPLLDDAAFAALKTICGKAAPADDE